MVEPAVQVPRALAYRLRDVALRDEKPLQVVRRHLAAMTPVLAPRPEEVAESLVWV